MENAASIFLPFPTIPLEGTGGGSRKELCDNSTADRNNSALPLRTHLLKHNASSQSREGFSDCGCTQPKMMTSELCYEDNIRAKNLLTCTTLPKLSDAPTTHLDNPRTLD